MEWNHIPMWKTNYIFWIPFHSISSSITNTTKQMNKQTLIPDSLQTSQGGTWLLWNQLLRSKNDLTPSPISPSDMAHNHWSFTNSRIVFSFCVIEKFLKAVGTWDEEAPWFSSWILRALILEMVPWAVWSRTMDSICFKPIVTCHFTSWFIYNSQRL